MSIALSPALAALAEYRQFCLYVTRPSKTKPGKSDKFPCNYKGEVGSAHDPAIWVAASDAIAWAAHLGKSYGVAFVLTEADPFFFIDIDSCLEADGVTWSPLAQSLLFAFAGCAVEISGSGRGLHIIGRGEAPPHSCRRDDLGLEFYTSGRFIALTGTGATGDAGHVVDAQMLPWLVENYFPPKAFTVAQDWTDEPCAEWRGPSDDAELLRRAMASKNAGHVFGNRASFADLWTANTPVLAGAYPSDTDEWNRSGADSALAAHLAFWTGRDCERIKRLMLQSELVREKWEREDYFYDTILNAAAITREVLHDKPIELPATLAAQSTGDSVTEPVAQLVTGSTYASIDDQLEIFKGCVYIKSVNRAWVPTGEILRPEAFRTEYGGYTFVLAADNGKVSADAWEAFTQSRAIRHPKVSRTCFRPLLPSGAVINEGGETMVNIYRPIVTPRVKGDPTPFFAHLKKLLPNPADQNILLAYLAACVQHKGVKFQWAPLLQGVEGNGKTFFSYCAAHAIGNKYVHWPKASQLGAQFNGWLFGKLLFCVEDIYTSRNKTEIIEELKPMITGKNLEIQNKGVDQETKDICGNFIFNTNHRAGLRKTRNDRRFAVMYTAQQESDDLKRDGMDGVYMSNLYDWADAGGFAIVSELLHTWEIPEHLNPATGCQRAPETSSTHDAIEAGRGLIEQHIQDAIDEGKIGFRGAWLSSLYLTRLLDEHDLKLSPAQRPETLKGLGYVPHPGLPRGRVNNTVNPDASKPILYIRQTHPAIAERHPAEIARLYSAAQLTS